MTAGLLAFAASGLFHGGQVQAVALEAARCCRTGTAQLIEDTSLARIPYADTADPGIRDLVERITRERGSVLHLYAMLLHSGPVAEGWLRFLSAIRHECALPGALRELVIMRVAQLNGAAYEAEQHAPIALREGVTQAQIDALDGWPESGLFDAAQRAVLAYCDAMTRTVHVPDEVFAAVRGVLDNRHLVELTATVGAYNMVSRFLEAMRIDARDELASGMPKP